MVLMVVVAFAVSWTPYFVVSLVTQWAQVNFLEEGHFFFTMLNLNLLAFLNSCVNPFIYAAMSARFRNGFLRYYGHSPTPSAQQNLLAAPESFGNGRDFLTLSDTRLYFTSRCFRLFCCFCMPVVEQKTTGQTDTRTRRVRFRCEPTCLIQSSSDGCSNVENNASLKTIVTPDNQKRSILKNHTRGSQGSFIAHYIKKNEKIIFNRKDPSAKDIPNIVKHAISNDIEERLKWP
ncbi:hypothetical protein JTE90_024381 [Oedothorax gibbosus]|uniref:G-protein coupled receptors family 1 profile domain-containing protein n=1 Tax=Oedothorax gibbosus TaxID=931172 RepID=A0AAV6TSI7_9ARAC|nr:hypothetical protein JTE90_024381 [Oedothorax gibbosus]